MLSKEQTQKFKQIYEDYFGKEISFEEASEKARKVLRMFELIYKPITKEDYANLQKRRMETDNL